jgi:hypothetical protein
MWRKTTKNQSGQWLPKLRFEQGNSRIQATSVRDGITFLGVSVAYNNLWTRNLHGPLRSE